METKTQEYIEYVLNYFDQKEYVGHSCFVMKQGKLFLSLMINGLFWDFTLIKEDSITAEKFCSDLEERIKKDIMGI